MSVQQEDPYDGETAITHRPTLRKKGKKADVELAQRRLALSEMLKPKPCRDFFWWLLEQFGPLQSPLSVAPNGTDVHRTLFNAGRADAGRLLLAEITAAAPDKYLLMLAEEQERKEMENA